MGYGLDIKWPIEPKNYHYYHDLHIDKNLNVLNNLNIKYNLQCEELIIKNNATFRSNVTLNNYIAHVAKSIKVKNANLVNTHFIAKQNTNAENVHMKLRNNSSGFTVKKNISVSGNTIIIGLFNVANNMNCTGNININNLLILENNLSTSHNLNVYNTLSKSQFDIKGDIELNNITVEEDFNIKGNLDLDNMTVRDSVYIRNDIMCKTGIVKLPTKYNLLENGHVGFNTSTNNIEAFSNNEIIILNDSIGNSGKSRLEINNNNLDIHISNNKNKSVDIFKNNINIYFESNILHNLNIKGKLSVANNTTFNNTLYFQNNLNANILLPTTETKKLIGAIRYNNNTNKIEVFYNSNKWNDLTFTDINNTSINRNSNNILFNIKNNNIIHFNKNTYINNTTYISNNLNIDDSLFIHNNLHAKNNININGIPLQFYHNLLRSYNSITDKWTSVTMEELETYYKIPFKTSNFYSKNISTHYTVLNSLSYINYDIALINKYNHFEEITIVDKLYISHMYINLVNLAQNTYYIQIYNNNTLIKEILFENKNNTQEILELDSILEFVKNDVIKLKIKSTKKNINDSILVNLLGYSRKLIHIRGDSNFITDNSIQFNNNKTFNIDTTYYNNINVKNNFIYNTSKTTNLTRFSALKDTHNSNNLFEIDNNFIVNHIGKIGVGTTPTNSLITVYSDKNTTAFENTGGISILSNLNSYNVITNNINIANNINSSQLSTNTIPLVKDLQISRNINCEDTLISHGKININEQNNITTNLLSINNYSNNIDNTLDKPNIKKLYLYANNNSLCNIVYNNSNSQKNTSIFHSDISYANHNVNINNDTIHISHNSVGLFTKTQDIFNINIDKSKNSYLSIVPNGNIIIKANLIVDNININEKWKNILYDVYGPKDPLLEYNFTVNNSVQIYTNHNYSTYQLYKQFTSIANNITQKKINNIEYSQLLTKPSYNNIGFPVFIDIVYFTEVILQNNNSRTFENNVSSYKTHNPYNYTISIFYLNETTVYPEFITYRNGVKYINYGLKTVIYN